MKKTYRWAVIFWSILLLTPSSAQADFYMKAKTMGFASETWTAGKKQRMQTQTPMAGSMITIVRVDKGVEWTVNSKMKIYQEKPIALTPKDIQEQDSGMAEIKNLMPQKQQGSDCTPQMNRLSEKRTYAGYETEGYQWACKEQPASMTMWIAPAQGDLARVEKETEAYSDAYQKELFKNYPDRERKEAEQGMKMMGSLFKSGFAGGIGAQMPHGVPLAGDMGGAGAKGMGYEVTVIDTHPVNPLIFDLPPGYRKVADVGAEQAKSMMNEMSQHPENIQNMLGSLPPEVQKQMADAQKDSGDDSR